MKFIITSLVALSITVVGFGQKKNHLDDDHENFFRIGAKAGVNINKIQGKAFDKGFNYNYQAGVFVQFNFSRTFGLQPEVSLVQTTTEFSQEASDVYDDLFRDGTQKNAKLNYLEIPILLNINVGTSKRVKLQLGPSFGSVLKETTDSLKAPVSVFKKSEVSAIGGLWIQLPVINIGARYKYGFTDVNALKLDNQEWHNQAIQIFVGFSF